MGKVYTCFWPKRPQNPTRWGDTYLYGLYKRVPPPPLGIYVSLLDKTFGDSNRNLAFDLSITGCQPGVWEATGTISAVDSRIISQSLPHVREFSDFSERSHRRSFVTSFSLPCYRCAGNRANFRCFLSGPYAMLLYLSLDSLFPLFWHYCCLFLGKLTAWTHVRCSGL